MILLFALALAAAPPAPVLVVHDRGVVQGLDPDDGALLWEEPFIGSTDKPGVVDGPSVVIGKMRVDASGMSVVPVAQKLAEVQVGENASGLYYISRGDEILWSGSGGTVLGVVEDNVVVLPLGEPYGVEVYALLTGKLRWSKENLSVERPALLQGLLLVEQPDHSARILSPADGRELLALGPTERRAIPPVPGLVIVGTAERQVVVDLRTGRRVPIDKESSVLGRLEDGTVLIATRGPYGWWIEGHRDGELQSRWPCPPGNEPAVGVAAGDLVLVRRGAVLVALDARSGAVRWTRAAVARSKPDAFEAWAVGP